MSGEGELIGESLVPLGSIGSFRRGQGGTKADARASGVPCVRYGDLYTQHDAVIRDFASFIAPESVGRYTALQYGDVVFAASGETHEEIGMAAAYCGTSPAYAGGDTIIFRPDKGHDPKYLGYAVNSRRAARFKARYGQGSSVIHIAARHLEQLEIYAPGAAVERRIAEILDTLDEAIHKTEQVIAKLRQLKQGLLHDLLTRGIDENGELRDPEHHPEQFKDSPLGRVPRSWQSQTLGDSTTWTSGGTPSKSISSFWRGSIPWVSPKDMKVFRLNTAQDKVTKAAVTAGSRLAPEGSVLVVVRGMILAHTFPVCLTTRPVAFNQDVKAVFPGSELDSTYLAHWFVGNSHRLLGLVTEATHGTKRIDLNDLLRFPMFRPPIAEQRDVTQRVDRADDRVSQELANAKKLRALKVGLLDDLLTGRVRVSPT